jgi:ABC-type amino acid transport substrate-binding protein
MKKIDKLHVLQIFLIILGTVLLSGNLSACSSSNAVQSSRGESLYDRIIRTGKIRCGYVVYSPGCLKDPNTGKLSGIGIDTLELVAKKLGLTVEWVEEVGWGTMLEGLQTGRYDMIATTIWTNANRARLVGFSKPLFYSPIFVYAKKGDNRFKDHLDLINSSSIKIATVDGETGQVIAEADFPKAKRLSLPQMSDISQDLLNVSTGKADVSFAEPLIAEKFLRNNPGAIQNIDPAHPVRVFPNCWMFNRGEFEFKSMIDTVLDEVINSGALDKIIDKYQEGPNLIYRVALPYRVPTASASK